MRQGVGHARRATSVPCVEASERERAALRLGRACGTQEAGPAAAWHAVSSWGDQLTKRRWRRQASEARHCAVDAMGGAGTDGGRGGRELDQVVFKGLRRPGVLGRPGVLARRHPCRATEGGMQRTSRCQGSRCNERAPVCMPVHKAQKLTRCMRNRAASTARGAVGSGRSLDGRARCGCPCNAVRQSRHVGR